MGRRSKRQEKGRSAAETRWARHEDGISKAEIAKNLERLKELKRRRGQLFTREEVSPPTAVALAATAQRHSCCIPGAGCIQRTKLQQLLLRRPLNTTQTPLFPLPSTALIARRPYRVSGDRRSFLLLQILAQQARWRAGRSTARSA